MNTISVEELEKIDSSKITIVDVRPADQYSRGSFPGAVNIPLDEFEERMESVDREKMVYVLCHTGDRSRDCVEKLSDAGYEAVNIEGGYRAYLRLSLSRFMENDAKDQKELKTKEIEHSIIKTFRKTVWRPFTKALNEYQLIQEGDKIAVCISGGKDSMLMAKLLQEQLVSALNPGSNRKCKKSDGVYLMEHIDCTGVLIECGFLSNVEEEARLSCGTYQKKLCCVIAATVSQYLSNT